MRISEACKRLEVSTSWLRLMEHQGKIPAAKRDVNGDRRYSEADLEMIRRRLLGESEPEPAPADGGVEGR